MNNEIKDLILYESLNNGFKYKAGLKFAVIVVSSIRFTLSYIGQIDEFKKYTYKEIFFMLAVKDNFVKDNYNYKNYMNKYKDNIKKNKHSFYDDNKKIYEELDNKDKELINDLFKEIYGDVEEGLIIDFYLLNYMKYLYIYIKRLHKIFDKKFIDKISNIKMFSLGIYTDNDYKLVKNYCDNLYNKLIDKYDLDDKSIYERMDIYDFHDTNFDIIIENDKIKFMPSDIRYFIFNKAKIINNDNIKGKLNKIKDGYVYYLFKYKNGKYLGIFDFNGIDENILIEFESVDKIYPLSKYLES